MQAPGQGSATYMYTACVSVVPVDLPASLSEAANEYVCLAVSTIHRPRAFLCLCHKYVRADITKQSTDLATSEAYLPGMLYVCMYVCPYVCLSVGVYVCMYVCMYVMER